VVDLHSHVLPGIDDGPADSVASVALADAAAAAGVRVMVATPHVRPDYPEVRVEEIRARAAEFDAIVTGYGIPLRILPGAELSQQALPELDDDALRAAALGGNDRDLLLETPWEPFGLDFEDAVDDLLARGFRVTLAHPERSPTLQADPARLGRLVEQGALVQVTASSLLGGRRSAARRVGLLAIERSWATVLASDAHAVDWRPPDLAAGAAAARRALPLQAREVEWMVTDAPRAIVEGRELPARPPRGTHPARLGRLRGGR